MQTAGENLSVKPHSSNIKYGFHSVRGGDLGTFFLIKARTNLRDNSSFCPYSPHYPLIAEIVRQLGRYIQLVVHQYFHWDAGNS